MRGRISTGHRDTDRALNDLRDTLGSVESCPLLSGRLIEGVELGNATPRRIHHGLERRLRGWLITDLVGATSTGRIERVVDADVNLTRDLWLMATGWGATITVALWVF